MRVKRMASAASGLVASPAQRAKHFGGRAYWYRLLTPYYGNERAQAMIDQWPNLGIIEPAAPPDGYSGTFHVEVAPLDPPGEDPTVGLVAAVEQLSAHPTALAAAAAVAPAKKRFKPPRIHYRRGEV
jgi:hypothetical protein